MIRRHRALPLFVMLSFWIAAVAAGAAARAADAPAAKRAPGGQAPMQGTVDVNAASEEELTAVPGIGKSLAHRIVEFREKNGPYQRVEDLMKVQGIGEKSFQKLRPYFSVGKAH